MADLTPFRQAAETSGQGFRSVLGAIQEQVQLRRSAKQAERDLDMRKDLITFEMEEQQRITAPQRQAQAQQEFANQVLEQKQQLRTDFYTTVNQNYRNMLKHFGDKNVVPLGFEINPENGSGVYLMSDSNGQPIAKDANTYQGTVMPRLNAIGKYMEEFEANRERFSNEDNPDATNYDQAKTLYDFFSNLTPEQIFSLDENTPEQLIQNSFNDSLAVQRAYQFSLGASNFNLGNETIQTELQRESRINDADMLTMITEINRGDGVVNLDLGTGWWEVIDRQSLSNSKNMDFSNGQLHLNFKTKSVGQILDELDTFVSMRGSDIETTQMELINQQKEMLREMTRRYFLEGQGTISDPNKLYLNTHMGREATPNDYFIPEPVSEPQETEPQVQAIQQSVHNNNVLQNSGIR